MTLVIECVRAGLRACDCFDSAERVWPQLLGLALTHGWLPRGTTNWHTPQGETMDYSAPDWLHAKTVSWSDAREIAKALRAVSTTDALWPIVEKFAMYCDGGGFVFACDQTDRCDAAFGASPNL
jgi:hypothetical protein